MDKRRAEIRRTFQDKVLSRDKHRCKVCSEGSTKLFAHRIINWSQNGGFLPENGITLCLECKHRAPEANPEQLYHLIETSRQYVELLLQFTGSIASQPSG